MYIALLICRSRLFSLLQHHGMSTWRPLLRLLRRYPTVYSSRVTAIDLKIGCPIFKSIAVTLQGWEIGTSMMVPYSNDINGSVYRISPWKFCLWNMVFPLKIVLDNIWTTIMHNIMEIKVENKPRLSLSLLPFHGSQLCQIIWQCVI